MNANAQSDSVSNLSQGNTKSLALIGVMAAVTCIMGPLSIPLPFSPVPISLTNLAVYVSIYILGMKKGSISYIIYMLIGLVGLPVFSSFTGGPGKLLGPTGGYLIGFLFMAVIGGLFIDKWPDNICLDLLGMVIGTLVMYVFGTVWLAYQAGLSFQNALIAGVIPFIPGDLAKIIIAALIAPKIVKRLKKAGLN
ncbi:MAG: biotin transporter BioY [Lachnospiraceae bacterium]|nr:biotin transporter BioY [Lachnospiraceae bacterium]